MLSYDEAITLVLKHVSPLESEHVDLGQASGRFLAETPLAIVDLPPFLTSSVDGYAITLPSSRILEVSTEAPAGATAVVPDLKPGQAVQVFTGSPLPSNSAAVVMVEDVVRDGNRITMNEIPAAGENLRPKGEEMTAGQELIEPGIKITPPVLALLANSGNAQVRVVRKLKVAVVEIGSELQDPGAPLRPGAIYSANGLALAEACKTAGGEVRNFRSSDDYSEIESVLNEAIQFGDVVITSGGVSVGKYDHVKAVWKNLGANEVFWRSAIRPGKPIYFATREGKSIFGLPGNPVSTLVTFFLFVRPALMAMNGLTSPPWIKLRTTEELISAPNVDIFLRVKVEEGLAVPLSHQGSHMLSGLANADALLRIPKTLGKIAVGSTLPALLLDWNK